MKIFINGLTTGLFLQLAIGPVFFFIVNLALQKTLLDGLVAVLAVVLVDYFYIGLAVLGIGKLLEQEKIKKVFGIISSLILIIFGLLIFKNIVDNGMTNTVNIDSANLFSSFTSVFLLTISNPMTIVFFTGLFTAKAIEYNYKKRELYIFGFAVGLATLLFMGTSVILFSFLKEAIPIIIIQTLNLMVGVVLIGYGGIRIKNFLKN